MSNSTAAQGYDFDEDFDVEFGETPAAALQPVQVEPMALAGDINPRAGEPYRPCPARPRMKGGGATSSGRLR